jgi:SagB-type dehydrogenase family enzyme
MDAKTIERLRYFLKDNIRQEVDFSATEQALGLPPPPIEKPWDPRAKRLDLPRPDRWPNVGQIHLDEAIRNRVSHRRFGQAPLQIDELAFLLWATQGIRKQLDAGTALRTVPSAGARHALETYLCVLNVQDVEPGVYRYLPLEHRLLHVAAVPDLTTRLTAATLGQSFSGRSAVTFVWTTVPHRMEWRYGSASHKVIALDAGHVCQNLYLACEAIGAGTCAIAAYNQEAMDQLVGVDGQEEFTVYVAPVGKKHP